MFCQDCGSSIPSGTKFCGNCGARIVGENLEPTKRKRLKDSKGEGLVCPVCGQMDSCQRVSTIVDSGNAVSVGLSTFSTWSTHPVVGSGVSVNASSTNLARRLSVGIPEASFQFQWFFTGLLLAIILVYQWAKQGNSGDSLFVALFFSIAIGLIPGVLLGIALGFIVKGIETRKLAPIKAASLAAQLEVRNAYYCFRDDCLFNGDISGTPEEVKNWLVNQRL